MKAIVFALWNDEFGSVVTAEIVLVSTILLLGSMVGLSEIESALTYELNDLSNALGSLDQTYGFNGFRARGGGSGGQLMKANVAGSRYVDTVRTNQRRWQVDVVGDVPEQGEGSR